MDNNSPASSPHRCALNQPTPDFVICGVPRHMEEDPETGWYRRKLFFGPTSFLDELCVHVGLLSGHVTTHPPHRHEHEELQIALSKSIEFVCCDADSAMGKALPIDKGALLFTDSDIPHTFRNTSSQPAAYLHVRWKNTSSRPGREMMRLQFQFSPGGKGKMPWRPTDQGCETVEIYSGPTRLLPHLRALYIRLQPGGVIPFHRHAHEVIFALVSGSVDILGRKVDAPGFAFMGTLVPHCIDNRGLEAAELYTFELHPEA